MVLHGGTDEGIHGAAGVGVQRILPHRDGGVGESVGDGGENGLDGCRCENLRQGRSCVGCHVIDEESETLRLDGEGEGDVNRFGANADYDVVAASENDGEEASAERLLVCEEFALDVSVFFFHCILLWLWE